jgi:hypothetical protein
MPLLFYGPMVKYFFYIPPVVVSRPTNSQTGAFATDLFADMIVIKLIVVCVWLVKSDLILLIL